MIISVFSASHTSEDHNSRPSRYEPVHMFGKWPERKSPAYSESSTVRTSRLQRGQSNPSWPSIMIATSSNVVLS
ncbi:MAG: hypothetical protein ACR2HO_06330 [Rubrobacteraceae bacterium]